MNYLELFETNKKDIKKYQDGSFIDNIKDNKFVKDVAYRIMS